MLDTVNKLFSFLDSKLKASAMIIFMLIIISMVIETFSIGLIIPAIAIFTENNIVENYPYFSKILASLSPLKFFTLNNSEEISNNDIIAGGMVVFLIVYTIKAAYLLFFDFMKARFCFELQGSVTKKLINGYLNLPFSFFSNRNDVTLVVSSKEHVIPYGTCKLTKKGHLQKIIEKPKFDFFVNVGLYVMSPNIIKLIPKNKNYDITDLIQFAKRKKNK